MDNLSSILTTLGLVVGTVVLLGGSLALVRGSYSKARIQALREDNDDLRARMKDCEDKCDAAEARELVLGQRVEHLMSENGLLTALVTQRANVDEVMTMLAKHHEAAMAGQAALTAVIGTMINERNTQ